jgi:hypothetical protein
MSRTLYAAFVFAGALLATSAASAGSPVAVVEQLSGNPAGLEIMDYVETGRIIRLGAGERIVLSYFDSCTRETITGGTVTVGTERSEVLSGKVERIKFHCDRGKASLASEVAIQVSGRAFRGLKNVPQ